MHEEPVRRLHMPRESSRKEFADQIFWILFFVFFDGFWMSFECFCPRESPDLTILTQYTELPTLPHFAKVAKAMEASRQDADAPGEETWCYSAFQMLFWMCL